MSHFKSVFLYLLIVGSASADDQIQVKLLANAGVLVSYGETKVVFDPLFDHDYGYYDLVPKDIEQALFEGAPPFDGLDAVFASHHHGDHFSPEKMLDLMRARPELQLFAPEQAIASMPLKAGEEGVRERLHSVALAFDGRYEIEIEDMIIDAVRIPHSGWPDRHADVENISFRVSLDSTATVVHLGDATTNDMYFENNAAHWADRHSHLALPPYWFFLSKYGQQVLDDRIGADENLGIHVPHSIPDDPANYPDKLRGKTLLSIPGEERSIRIIEGGEAR